MSASIPHRLLLGAGPTPVSERVLAALAQPTIGHLDPAFAEFMEQTTIDLRRVFGTENLATLPISGTGSAGMDAMVANFVEPGDRVVCGVHGLFGERMADALARAGAEVVRVESDSWGRAIPIERLIEATEADFDALFLVLAETSTGVLQPTDGLSERCRERDALFMIDCVTALGGVPVELDARGVDAAFSGTQKCLGCPPGLAPFSAGERAIAKLKRRRTPVRSWYFDLSLVLGYWEPGAEGTRVYHHTAPINMIYGLAAALEVVHEEGLEARFARHRHAHDALRSALAVYGFERLAPEGEALPPLLCVRLPETVQDAPMRRALLEDHNIEVSGGIGPLAGKTWRIGVMGEGAWREPQERFLRALAEVLGEPADEAVGVLDGAWNKAPAPAAQI